MLIGISGRARTGKDTTADYIIKKLKEHSKASFAEPIKKMLRAGLGLTHEHTDGALKDVIHPLYGVTPRHMMQTLGTQWGRHLIHDDIWVLRANELDLSKAIISDVRFNNEADFIRNHGYLIHIVRASAPKLDHESERGIEFHPRDFLIRNHDTKRNLYLQIDNLLHNFRFYEQDFRFKGETT